MKLEKKAIELITAIGGASNIKEVKEIINTLGEEVEKLAYNKLIKNK